MMERFNRERAKKLLQQLHKGVERVQICETYYVPGSEEISNKIQFKKRIKFMEVILQPIMQRKIKDIRIKPQTEKSINRLPIPLWKEAKKMENVIESSEFVDY